MKKLILFVLVLMFSVSCVEVNIINPQGGGSDQTSEVPDTDTDLPQSERSEGMLIVQSNQCACQNGESVSIGNCRLLCAQLQHESDSTKTLFMEVEETEALKRSYLKDIEGFCSTQDSDDHIASCSIEAMDQHGNKTLLPFNPLANQKIHSLDVQGLKINETYRLKIVENSSGVGSTSFLMLMLK